MTQHPEIEEKVINEIVKYKEMSNGLEGFDFASQLTYTEMVLLESLRLHPPVPGDDREALNDDKLPDGTIIKKGFHIAFDPYSFNRNKKVWGEDALDFKPERWWDSQENKLKSITAFEYPTFSAGPRLCLGRNLALLEAKSLISELLPKYKFTIVPGHVVKYKMTITLVMENGLLMTIKKRQE